MARSEELVVVTVAAWERSIGRVRHRTGPFPNEPDAAALKGAVRRLDEVARRWPALERGDSMTLTWPERLSLDTSKPTADVA